MIPENLQNLDAERTLLGAMASDPDAVPQALQQLEARHFADKAHGRIFEAIAALFERGDGVDLLTLRAELGADLPTIGGGAFLGKLIEGMPRITNLDDWIAIVLERARRRAAYNLARRLMEQATDDAVGTDELLDRHQSGLSRLIEVTSRGTLVDMRTAIKQAFVEIDRFVKGSGVTGIPSGLPDLDEIVGGWQADRLVLLAARPGQGKSTMLAQWISHAGTREYRGLVFSMEMSPALMVERMLYADASIERWDLKVKDTAWGRLVASHGRLGKHLTVFDERETPTMAQIRSQAQMVHKRVKLDYIAVDYLQRVSFDGRLEERIGVGHTALGLKSLARHLKVPVIAACQLNRAAESKEPSLGDLAESGRIEREADIIAFLHPDPETKSAGLDFPVTHFILGKHRQGACRRFKLSFEKRWNRFVSLANQEAAQAQLPRGDR